MKTKCILAALRKCKDALEWEAHCQHLYLPGYRQTDRYRETVSALTEAGNVLADWQAETLKKSEAFR